MESVLHITTLSREITPPISIGNIEYLFFGDKAGAEDDLGAPSSSISLGAPLDDIDVGNTRSHIPLIKTFEYMPDPYRNTGNVYLETVHYFDDNKYLIPIRSKIHSGYSQGLRLCHTPSLNYVRNTLCGCQGISEPRSHIVSDLVENDSVFLDKKYHPITDWIRDDLIYSLDNSTISTVEFSSEKTKQLIYKFLNQINMTPRELNNRHLKDISSIVSFHSETYPPVFDSKGVVGYNLLDVKNRLVSVDYNFGKCSKLKLDSLPGIEVNPHKFYSIFETIDCVPLTDFNIDVIVELDNSISFVHEGIAINRLAIFIDNDLGSFSSKSLLSSVINETFMAEVIHKFMNFHEAMNGSVWDTITSEPIKIKMIKTLQDEILVLLYRYNSTKTSDPLCGIYFDIALQSLAPTSVIYKPIKS